MDQTIHKQVLEIEKALEGKSSKGISFALKAGNDLRYVNIPTHPLQAFKYFENTSKLTKADRDKLHKRETLREIFLGAKTVLKNDIDG